MNYQRGYPALHNDDAKTAFCRQVVRDWLGEVGASYWVRLVEAYLPLA